VPDYQISAFLMAVYYQSMTPTETATLTELMRDSGIALDLSEIDGFKVDKHSTGGVGDKVSLVLAPLVASAGLIVPMISGRALAHTGGTLDKLEAIPGFRTDLSILQLKEQLQKTGVALIGQTENLCPADKKMYALRDATATVNALPLITASILSKKMAEGIDALVLDVKAGSGAIFENAEKAWELGRMLIKTADRFGLKTVALITSMTQPLGNAVGNWLETKEAIETLKGEGPADLTEITLALGAQMIVLGSKAQNLSESKELLKDQIRTGAAYAKFLEIVASQGGDVTVIEEPSAYPAAQYRYEVKSPREGYVAEIQSREIGRISMALGAGRRQVTDKVDYTSGIILQKKVGDQTSKDETLAVALSNDEAALDIMTPGLKRAFRIVEEEVKPESLLLGLIDQTGEKKWSGDSGEFT
ncbi:thymidine phosphorylase, partial [bacterium]|nr:thymidine phosphorylase [bacterium]